MPNTINDQTRNLVRMFEGQELEAYRCPAGVLTIGYGHTGNVTEGQRITAEQAEALLQKDLEAAGRVVSDLVIVPLNNNQFGALASFVFNVGRENFASSTLLKKLNAGNYRCVPEELNRWVKATVAGQKITLNGLVKRRAAEGELWEDDGPPIGRMPQVVDPP